ncbi:AraC family transcriptional regulator [Rhodococcus sp. BP-149]|uniref:helix-turn-helix domain-containing protein n=1 Tax=unclassified Rhodococcus (in: high G+C Gram-positive bacteria) TaxID=192944 RepID=UPI001C9B954D|nr:MULTISPECIES: helix-turn-helix domain-containing protein [unclassified Rhodococcus (in: high G+C Gram-positive bacteria)]MBY6684013.1 AraC family transcriptional regulator [Rhodococcus sp. BP-288]MBY6693326.1 AraC family transcriptional regulator [Rhodococcus sp. BP-188]MBY6697523.1 AraC family transcriptional regulator [Rhodococcus sp. BP-285]MBY6702200.1 AraC family transcriptional regulator [Rhodococcus sp. BP-283]MBY6709867.1 AraC family transcriptional regulator [Rhodococcus sp. BP-160
MTEDPLTRAGRRAQSAILHPARAEGQITVGRSRPPDGLATLVDYFWWVEWHCPEPHVQEVVPRPVVHLTAESRDGAPRLLVHGVMRRRFQRTLVGDGRTVAAAFRPAGFRPVLGRPVSSMTDRIGTVADVLGTDDRRLAGLLLDPDADVTTCVDRLSSWLIERTATADPVAADIADLVELAETDTTVIRAQQLADRAGVSLRTLQRQFADHVGVGPKWVVQRCRLLDVAGAAHTDGTVDWAALAADLGYADQSHLVRAFTALVGSPPARYRADT